PHSTLPSFRLSDLPSFRPSDLPTYFIGSPTTHRTSRTRPFRPSLSRARIRGDMRLSSCAHADDATRTRRIPSAVTDSGSVTAAICGPTSVAHSSTIPACCIRFTSPCFCRLLASASARMVGGVRRFMARPGRRSIGPPSPIRLSALPRSRRYAPAGHVPDLDFETGGQLVPPRRRHEDLTISRSEEPRGELLLAAPVQLRKGVVQQERGHLFLRGRERIELEQLERNRRAPLLAGGAEAPELASADLEDQVVAMRPHRGEP